MITINGQFTARRVTGQERFAFEIISELDKICKKGQYTLVCLLYTSDAADEL